MLSLSQPIVCCLFEAPAPGKFAKFHSKLLRQNLPSTFIYICCWLIFLLQKCKLVSVKSLTPILANIKPKDLMQVIESVFLTKHNMSPTVCTEHAEELIAAALLNCDFSECEHEMERLATWKDHIRSSRWLVEMWPEEECCR